MYLVKIRMTSLKFDIIRHAYPLKIVNYFVSGFNMLAALILEVMEKQESESLQVHLKSNTSLTGKN